MNDLLQRARDIAADQYIRLEMKRPTDRETFADWSAHIARYAGWMRAGEYDACHEVQTALAALRAEHARPETTRTIYVQWADNGNIRKWDWSEFELAERIKAEALTLSSTSDDAPFDYAGLFLGAFGAAANIDKRKTGSVDEGAAYLRKHIEAAFVPVDWYVKAVVKINTLRSVAA